MAKHKTYIEQIDDRILELETEINDLRAAKRVLRTLALRHEQVEVPTVPTVPTVSTKVSKTIKTRRPHMQKKLMGDIIHILTSYENREATSAQLIAELNARQWYTGDKQRVWAALGVMKKQGTVTHNPDRNLYSLAPKGDQ